MHPSTEHDAPFAGDRDRARALFVGPDGDAAAVVVDAAAWSFVLSGNPKQPLFDPTAAEPTLSSASRPSSSGFHGGILRCQSMRSSNLSKACASPVCLLVESCLIFSPVHLWTSFSTDATTEWSEQGNQNHGSEKSTRERAEERSMGEPT